MNYRLIALDVDGTLLNDDHVLTETTKRTVRRVHEAGARIVLCTGRSPANTLPLLERELGLEGIVITHNGACTVRSKDRAVLDLCAFELEQIRPYVEYCRGRSEIHFDLCTPFELFVERMPPQAAAMYRKFQLEPVQEADVLTRSPLVKMSVYCEDKAVMDELQLHWERNPGALTTIRSGDFFIDVMHPHATKGNALRRLAAEWGIPREHILAIGNYYNDQEMIEFAGLGIAVANSPDRLKQAADVVAPSNNENGVSLALLEHCFGE